LSSSLITLQAIRIVSCSNFVLYLFAINPERTRSRLHKSLHLSRTWEKQTHY